MDFGFVINFHDKLLLALSVLSPKISVGVCLLDSTLGVNYKVFNLPLKGERVSLNFFDRS